MAERNGSGQASPAAGGSDGGASVPARNECEVVIVGGGPAGLAAATALKARGVGRVVVIDRETTPGGIPRHCDHYPFGLREVGRLLTGPAYARRLVAQALAAGVEIRSSSTVTALRPGPVVEVSTPEGMVEIAARRVLLATGVRETTRAARLIGGTKPGGVLSTGALQGLVHLNGQKPFARPVVLGSELVAFSALLTCRKAGIRPIAMIEPGPRATARWPSALLPRLLGIPLHVRTDLVAIEGERWVTGVVVRDAAGVSRRIATDGVIVSGRFRPEATLIAASHLAFDPASGGPRIDQFGRCSDPAFFAAGNLLRPVETAGWSWAEGRAAAEAIADSLAGRLPAAEGGLTLTAVSGPLTYAVPQRIRAGGAAAGGHRHVQLRVSRAATGTLVVRVDGRTVWADAMTVLPERRILIPIAALPRAGAATVEFVEAHP